MYVIVCFYIFNYSSFLLYFSRTLLVFVREEPGIIPGENSPSKRWLTATLPQGIVHHQPLLSGQRLLLGIKCPDEVGPVAVGSGGDVVWLEEVDGQLLIILNVLTV